MAELAAVAFDLDDTLFDHHGASRQAVRTWLPTLGGRYSPEMVDAWFAAERRHFPAWRDGLASFQEQRRRRLRDMLELLGLPPRADDALDALFGEYLAAYRDAWGGYDDVEVALAAVSEAGLRAVHIDRRGTGPEDEPARITSLHELAAHLTSFA